MNRSELEREVLKRKIEILGWQDRDRPLWAVFNPAYEPDPVWKLGCRGWVKADATWQKQFAEILRQNPFHQPWHVRTIFRIVEIVSAIGEKSGLRIYPFPFSPDW